MPSPGKQVLELERVAIRFAGDSGDGMQLTGTKFTEATALAGNDLSTPRPEWGFPGLAPGDRWCVCAARWLEAHRAGVAPPVVLGATHEGALEVVPIELLTGHALEPDPS